MARDQGNVHYAAQFGKKDNNKRQSAHRPKRLLSVNGASGYAPKTKKVPLS